MATKLLLIDSHKQEVKFKHFSFGGRVRILPVKEQHYSNEKELRHCRAAIHFFSVLLEFLQVICVALFSNTLVITRFLSES